MNLKTLEEIDYFRIKDEIANYCVSEEGKKAFLERQPLHDIEKIEFLKKCSKEWNTYLSVSSANPVKAWNPISPLIAVIRTKGASLNLSEVYSLGQFCLSARNVRIAIENHKDELKLKALASQLDLLPDLQETEKKIFRIISTDGEMRDLPEIAAIRSQIASLNSKIKSIMQKFTSDGKLSSVLESNVPVLRSGRQVLAVKASQQNRIKGIIHEVSQTAQTVFIEPDEAVICSNELIQKEYELQAEIKRVLTELTESLQVSIPDLKKALPVMILFDGTLASARWAREKDCIYALPCILNDNSGENKNEAPLLIGARHPLLGEKAVPIDIRFMSGKRVLIITGPNTGGKTVSLKTFSLLAMLNQTGLPIPASEGTRLPVFGDIFADIGDSQSLDMSLSTFSGHMKNIAQACRYAKDDSLVLLDELGSGTDPQEGTAISMAVLDTLIEKKSFVLVTTHQGILKNYGYTNPSCINASVEFNTDTLSPSYHLVMGVPGESHALDIAAKSGLPKEICKNAKNYISKQQADVSALIQGLNKKHLELNKLQAQVSRLEKENEEKQDRLKQKELDLRRKEHEVKLGKQQELNDFLIHSRRQLENLVRTLKEGDVTRDKTLAVKKYISDLEKETERHENKIELEEEKLNLEVSKFEKELSLKNKAHVSNKKTKKKLSNKEALALAKSLAEENKTENPQKAGSQKVMEIKRPLIFEEGAIVSGGISKNEGVLIKLQSKGKWQVQFGSVRMTMKEKDLKLIRSPEDKKLTADVSIDLTTSEYMGQTIIEKDVPRPVFELNLLGMYQEEAIKALERQIDLCTLQNFPHFSVIHGKGAGILQQAVQDYLSHCPAVKDFSFAPAEDGGTGKTYVSLK